MGSYPLHHGGQALSDTGSSPVPATLREDASASFFCLGRILALGPQDCQ